MIEAMIDIETMGVRKNAVVLSIGARKFRRDGSQLIAFYALLDVQEQEDAGRSFDWSTLSWWLRQSAVARDEAFRDDGRKSVTVALGDLSSYLEGSDTVWANGTSFDVAILETLYADFGGRAPWKYDHPRDMRTVREEAGMPRDWKPTVPVQGVEHHPVYDCDFQIEVVREARRRIGLALMRGVE